MSEWLQSRSTWALALIGLAGSVAFGLAAPPSGLAVLALFGFVPLLWAAHGVRGRSTRAQFFVGWTGGLGTGLVGFPWIAETLERFGEFPAPLAYFGLFLFAAWTAVPYGMWMLSVTHGPQRPVLRWAWTVTSWVGITMVWPAFFPYTPLIGLSQLAPTIQAAELGGVPLVEALVLTFAYALAHGTTSAVARDRIRAVAGALVLLGCIWGLGAWRLAALDAAAASAPVLRVGIIQPNTALMTTHRLEKMRRLWGESSAAQREGAQLIVWPEAGIYPFVMTRPYARDSFGAKRVLGGHSLPTILGVATRAEGDPYEWNTAVSMNAQGEVLASFDKTILVPFGEYVPVVDPDWARAQVPAISHNHAGQNAAQFPVPLADGSATYTAGPLICYEDIFGGFAREVATQSGGIDFFVNVTIDTWFGDTAEPWEHLALAQFRSVEHRVPMVRSVAAGASSVIDHGGRLVASLEVAAPTAESPVAPAHLVHDVRLPRNTAQAPTIFARFGWLFGWLCVAGTVCAPLAAWGRTKYGPRAADADASSS